MIKILLVRVGKAGDMVMITPAIRALLLLYPQAEFHLLTSPEGRRVLRSFDLRITEFLIYPTGILNELLARHRIVRALKEAHYNHAYVFEADPRFHSLMRAAEQPASLLRCDPPLIHYSERCLSLVRQSAALPVQNSWIELPVTKEGNDRALTYLHQLGISETDLVVGFHATSSSDSAAFFRRKKRHIHRSWPAECFTTLARLLHRHAQDNGTSLKILIDALPDERRLVEPIVRMSGGIVTLVSAPPDFERYKGVLQRMALLVTPDTGPMHIAAAVGTPVVALFSRKSPQDCGPFVPADKYTALRAEETWNPELGLAAISPESVFQACLAFLPPLRSTN